MKQQTTIGGRECLLYTDGQPQVLLIQTLGGHEHNSIDTEVELIRTAKGFAWCLSKLKNNPVSNEI